MLTVLDLDGETAGQFREDPSTANRFLHPVRCLEDKKSDAAVVQYFRRYNAQDRMLGTDRRLTPKNLTADNLIEDAQEMTG